MSKTKYLLMRASGGEYHDDGFWAIALTDELLKYWRKCLYVYRQAEIAAQAQGISAPIDVRFGMGEYLWRMTEEIIGGGLYDRYDELCSEDQMIVEDFTEPEWQEGRTIRTSADYIRVENRGIDFIANLDNSDHEYFAMVSWNWLRDQGVDI